MPDPEYVRIKMTDIPDEFIEEYNLIGRDRDGWVYFEIRQGCYGLPQSGILANNSRELALWEFHTRGSAPVNTIIFRVV